MHQFALSTGVGALFLTVYLDYSKNKKNYIKLFFIFTIFFTFFEYLVGFTLDAIFADTWWDYSDEKYNINGRISLICTIFWGVMTLLFAICIYPLIQKFKNTILHKIPSKVQIFISSILIVAISIDFILSCIKYLK